MRLTEDGPVGCESGTSGRLSVACFYRMVEEHSFVAKILLIIFDSSLSILFACS